MEDEAILLKIKRQFEKDESINALLKMIGELRIEIAKLKSELAEKEFKIDKLKKELTEYKNIPKLEGAKTKREWLRDDLIKEMHDLVLHNQEKNKSSRKEMEKWQNMYYALLRQNLENKKNG